MTMSDQLDRLGHSAQRLNDGSDYLNRMIGRIDRLLGRLMIGLDYIHPRPLAEAVSADRDGKRVIELAYVGYLKVQRSYHLAIKTVKVLESKLAMANEVPGTVVPILAAPRRLRYAAVDVLPELVSGLAQQVEEVVGAMQRRCQTAEALVGHLEAVAGPAADDEPQAARTGKTLPPTSDPAQPDARPEPQTDRRRRRTNPRGA